MRPKPRVRDKAGPLQVARAVFWSFLGIRRRQDYEADAAKITLVQVVVAGLIGVAVLITSLLLLVRLVTS